MEGEAPVTQSGGKIDDNFMAMVTAKAEVTLPLSQFQPQSTLVTAEHHLERARFPVIDYHNHLDALDPVDVLRIMDACGIERIVNITMKTGEEAIRMIDKFRTVDPERFAAQFAATMAASRHRSKATTRPSAHLRAQADGSLSCNAAFRFPRPQILR